jgi:hypothetical protein
VSDIAPRQLVAIGAKADVTLISREETQVTHRDTLTARWEK